MTYQIYKFGGTSVGSAEAVRAAVEIVRSAAPCVGVVISASAGTTDLLLESARAALAGDTARFAQLGDTFRTRHLRFVQELIANPGEAEILRAAIEHSTHELRAMCESIAILQELTPRSQDAIVARGERAMALLFAAALREHGVAAEYVDATGVIFTERRLGRLWPDLGLCARAAEEQLLPRIQRGAVVVVPGFIGTGPGGEVVTLGRGGSDFSAALVARSTRATGVTLWKEVHGLLTADPRHVPDARVIPELHYREAAELAYYGAKVLHPRTMIPLVEAQIPLYVKNTFDPGFPGTRIAGDAQPGAYPVKALTAAPGQALVAVEGNGMMGVPGIAARTFGALAAAGRSVSMISQASSESSICLMVPAEEADDCARALREAFEQELARRLIDEIRVTRNMALLAVVGLGMRGTPGIAARTFGALGRERVNVVAVAQGASELNITMAIAEADVGAALKALHQEFQLSKLRPLASAEGREVSIAFLGFGRIGRALLRQVLDQETFLRNERGVRLLCTALADRSGLVVSERGFSDEALERLLARKQGGGAVATGEAPAAPVSIDRLRGLLRERLWVLPSYRPVLVDVTAEETAPLILDALRQRAHVVLANKKPLAVPQREYDEIIGTAREHQLHLRHEATVGAGLPILDTFAKLQEAGDTIASVTGCLSGTLGYLMTRLEDGVPYSQAVREAWELGYTEPDPRDDLSGMDVARKALILARTLGLRLDLPDIQVEPLFPASASDPDPRTFLEKLAPFDGEIAGRVEAARGRGQVLRYIARIDRAGVRVGIEAVDQASPAGRLRGTDNQVVITSKRYHQNPLVVIGPGAGAEVTAAGVLNDVVAIAVNEAPPRPPAPAR